MRIRDLLVETWMAFESNRGRSLLTILGIVIGIAAVVGMTALIGGVKQSLVGQLGFDQARLVNINVYPNREVTFDDLDKIAERIPEYEFITGATYGFAKASTGEKESDASVIGVKPEYFTAAGTKLKEGRLFSASEERSSAMVALIDDNSVKELYGANPGTVTGRTLRIGNDTYTICGVTESSGYYSMGDQVTAYLPYSTAVTRISGGSSINEALGFAREGADMTEIVETTKTVLADYFAIPEEERDYSIYVTSLKSLQDELDATMMSFELLMVAVAGISLLVGGIGIMNMMLTNVTERIREIGLRKALGARRGDITKQFLLESVVLCLVGGVIGVVAGYFLAWGFSGLAVSMTGGTDVVPVISPTSILVACGICVGIGILFGYYPARRAAKLDPVDALHYQ